MGSDFGEEILGLMSPVVAVETGSSSFTALLELPPTQAAELLHSPEEKEREESERWGNNNNNNSYNYPPQHISSPVLPCDAGLLERASRLSVFAAEEAVKREPSDSFDPTVDDEGQRSGKRKEREKGKDLKKKKSKTAVNGCKDEDEKLPYVYVRARRGQATDSHSLAERARREKINARMKLLQELVPGCNKISGTAMVLDEIISHVQSLQRQVEFLSMRLATVNPRIDFDIDSLLAAQGGSSMDCNFQSMVMPLIWPDGQVQYPQLCSNFDGLHIPEWGKEEKPMFISPDNSLLSYVSSTNSASLNLNQLKKET